MKTAAAWIRYRLPVKTAVHAGGRAGSVELLDTSVPARRLVIPGAVPGAQMLRDGREEVWRRMYGSKPMPRRRRNIAMEYSGSEGRGLNLTADDVDEIFEQLNNQ
ncbi:MAG: hypothetical protein MPJ06_01135 [Nitrosopumilus sp.]|nr:hypothetical protein [Nitrosopumilus sp.]MDA7942601.1 hypothetical protein [Nitrosopumilus sp.]